MNKVKKNKKKNEELYGKGVSKEISKKHFCCSGGKTKTHHPLSNNTDQLFLVYYVVIDEQPLNHFKISKLLKCVNKYSV